MLKPDGKQFIGDAHYYLCDDDVAAFLIENSPARQMPGSGTAIVENPEGLLPGTTIIDELSDGSVVINGESGECDAVAYVHVGWVREWCATHLLGLKLCMGWAWKYRKRDDGSIAGHNACWYCSPDGIRLFEPKRPMETAIFEPDPEAGWFHLMVV